MYYLCVLYVVYSECLTIRNTHVGVKTNVAKQFNKLVLISISYYLALRMLLVRHCEYQGATTLNNVGLALFRGVLGYRYW